MSAIKPLLCLLLLVLLFGCANALSISAEPAIPIGTQWSVSIGHSIVDGQDLKVFLDGGLLFDAYGRSSEVLADEKQKSPNVVAYSLSINELVLSVSGMGEGTRTISAKVLSGETQIDSAETSVDFFRAISYAEKNALNDKINSLEQTISSLEQDLNGKQQEIGVLRQSDRDFMNSLKNFGSEVSLLQQDSNSKQESLEKINSDLNTLITQREQQGNPLGGMFTFGASNSLAIGTIFLVAIVVIGLVLFARKKKGSLYKK